MKKFHLIYKTTNIVTGKIYVGKHSTNKLEDGYIGCGIMSDKDATENFLFHNSVRKHGYNNFSREIIEFCDSQYLNEREIFWIKELKSNDLAMGYNIGTGGVGGDNFTNNPRKEEIRENMRNSCNNKGLSGDKNPMWGKPSPMRGVFSKDHPLHGRKRPEQAIKRGKDSHFFGSNKTGELNPHFGKKNEIVNCPECGKSGGIAGMKHWHFNNCKSKVKASNYVGNNINNNSWK